MSPIASYLAHRYPGGGLNSQVREEVQRVCTRFIDSGFADIKFVSELTWGADSKYWSCLSEALIFDALSHMNFAPRPNLGAGPDFLLLDGERRVWIEVVCPEPRGIPKDWLEIIPNTVGNVPHAAILLRWTSAIKEKIEKLLGNVDGKTAGYLSKGVVSPEDIYVIAVNGCQLRHGPFPALYGISQFPYAAEAVFPIGPYQIRIDRDTQEVVGDGYQERFFIPKPNGASVPAHAFLDPRHSMIAAIWAIDFNACHVIGSPQPSAVIHNPLATNPLPTGLLLCDDEYLAEPAGDDEYNFQRVGGTKQCGS